MGAKPTVSPRIGAAPTVSQSCERCAPSEDNYVFAFDCRRKYESTRIYSPDPPCICHTKFPYCPSIRESAKLLRPDLVYDDPCELEPPYAAARTALGATHFRAVPADLRHMIRNYAYTQRCGPLGAWARQFAAQYLDFVNNRLYFNYLEYGCVGVLDIAAINAAFPGLQMQGRACAFPIFVGDELHYFVLRANCADGEHDIMFAPAGPVRTPFDPNGTDTGHGIGTLPCGLRVYRSSRPNPAPDIIYVMLYDPQTERWCAAHAPKALISTPCRMDDYGKVYPM